MSKVAINAVQPKQNDSLEKLQAVTNIASAASNMASKKADAQAKPQDPPGDKLVGPDAKEQDSSSQALAMSRRAQKNQNSAYGSYV